MTNIYVFIFIFGPLYVLYLEDTVNAHFYVYIVEIVLEAVFETCLLGSTIFDTLGKYLDIFTHIV